MPISHSKHVGRAARGAAIAAVVVPVAIAAVALRLSGAGAKGAVVLLAVISCATSLFGELQRRRAAVLERRFKTLLRSSQEAIYLATPEGTITFANRQMAELLLLPHEGLAGRAVRDLIPEAAERDVQVRRSDGALLDATHTVATVHDHAGDVDVVIGMLLDVTESIAARRALERACEVLSERISVLESEAAIEQPDGKDAEALRVRVEELAERLAGANAELETFSYSVSHDLRAPLRGIDGFSRELLLEYEENLDERGRHYLHRIRAATKRMGTLIDDLLDLARIGRRPMRRDRVDVTDLARRVAAEVAERNAGRALQWNIAPGLTASADPDLLRIVLENLLANAVKFSAPREPALIEVGDGDGAFFIRDNGVGFDPAHAGRMFAPFQRLHPSAFEGTGIGLAIVQRVVHRHGGKVWAESAPEQGATFRFTLGDRNA